MSDDRGNPVFTDRELMVVLRALAFFDPSAEDEEIPISESDRLCDERDAAHMKAVTAARARGLKLE